MKSLALLLLTVLASSSAAADQSRPNVLFILVDDFGARDLGCYGATLYRTPHMDRLAAEGLRCTQAYVAYPRCVPSRFAILTGKHPAKYQRDRDSVHVEPERDTTFGQAFQAAGYSTFYCGKWHLGGGESHPSRVGFGTTVAAGEAGATGSHFAPYNPTPAKSGKHKDEVPDLEDAPEGEYLTDRLTDETLSFLKEHKTEPFVAVLAHYAVHTPIEGKRHITKRYAERLASQKLPTTLFEQESAGENLVVQNNAEYAAMVESVDNSVGRLLKFLDRTGLADNTIVVLASDHGGLSARGNNREVATSNRPLRAGKGHLYEGGLRIPLIIRWPQHIRAGQVCDTPVLTTDLFPTLLGLADLPLQPNAHQDGIDLSELLLRGTAPTPRDFFWHNPAPRPTSTADLFSSAIRSGGWKLVEFPTERRIELYNLAEDLEESRNLADERTEVRDALLKKLHDWKAEVGASSEPRIRKRTRDKQR